MSRIFKSLSALAVALTMSLSITATAAAAPVAQAKPSATMAATVSGSTQVGSPAGVDSSGCAGTTGGCIHLVNGTVLHPPIDDPLYVHTIQGSLQGAPWLIKTCTSILIGEQDPGKLLRVIRTSPVYCFYGSIKGPIYTFNKRFADGTIFCAWGKNFAPDEKGCVKVHR